MPTVTHSEVPGVEPNYRGKVRDIYELEDRLLLVATDRISAFDVILPQAVPEKGEILTSISDFWFDQLQGKVENHRISVDAGDLPEPYASAARGWGPRFMVVDRLKMFPIECVVRGYLVGSGWLEYREQGTVCGIELPAGLEEAAELETPIFTPATKAETGHDMNISKAEAGRIVGEEMIDELERLSLEIYSTGREYAKARGVILADTKFEFGQRDGDPTPVLGDEVLTPDSSRYWPADQYRTGGSPPSFDKQFVRDFLVGQGWRGDGEPPQLPPEVIDGTVSRYREIYRRLTDREWVSA